MSASIYEAALDRMMASGVPFATAKSASTEMIQATGPIRSIIGIVSAVPATPNPSAGDSYIVTTGLFANSIAMFAADGIWHYSAPYAGDIVFNQGTATYYAFLSGVWVFQPGWSIFSVAGIAAAQALFPAAVTVPNGFILDLPFRSIINDGGGGTFYYDNTDTTTTFPLNGMGFVDNAGRRWKRQYTSQVVSSWWGTNRESAFVAGVSGTTLTVASVTTLSIQNGQYLIGPGVTAGTKVLQYVSGGTPGGAGVYLLDTSNPTLGNRVLNTNFVSPADTTTAINAMFTWAAANNPAIQCVISGDTTASASPTYILNTTMVAPLFIGTLWCDDSTVASISTFTAAMGATATGTGSTLNLTLSGVVGLVSYGDVVTGVGVTLDPPTTIVSQTSGTPGSDGVYVTNQATTSSSNALTISSSILAVSGSVTGTALAAGQSVAAFGADPATNIANAGTASFTAKIDNGSGSAGTIMTVTGTVTGRILLNSIVTGAGVTANTRVTAFLADSTGGAGTYTVSISQNVASETMATSFGTGTYLTNITQYVPSSAWKAFFTFFQCGGYVNNHENPFVGQSIYKIQRKSVGWRDFVNPDKTTGLTFINCFENNANFYIKNFDVGVDIQADATGTYSKYETQRLTDCRIQIRKWVQGRNGNLNQDIFVGDRQTTTATTSFPGNVISYAIQNDCITDNSVNGDAWYNPDFEMNNLGGVEAIGFTASVTSGVMTVTVLDPTTPGTLTPGQYVGASGITTNPRIRQQVNGVTGGLGDYQLTDASITVGSRTMSATFGARFTAFIADCVMTVSAVSAGVLKPQQRVSGFNSPDDVSGGTTIICQTGTGVPGGVGTYLVIPSQTVTSQSMTSQSQACGIYGDGIIPTGNVMQFCQYFGGRKESSTSKILGGKGLSLNTLFLGSADWSSSSKGGLLLPKTHADLVQIMSNSFNTGSLFPNGITDTAPLAEIRAEDIVVTSGAGTRIARGAIRDTINAKFLATSSAVARAAGEFSSSSISVGEAVIFDLRNGAQQDIRFSLFAKTTVGATPGGRILYECYTDDVSPVKLTDAAACSIPYASQVAAYRAGGDITAAASTQRANFDPTRVRWVIATCAKGTLNFAGKCVKFTRLSDASPELLLDSSKLAALSPGGGDTFYLIDTSDAISPTIPTASAIYGNGMICRNAAVAASGDTEEWVSANAAVTPVWLKVITTA